MLYNYGKKLHNFGFKEDIWCCEIFLRLCIGWLNEKNLAV